MTVKDINELIEKNKKIIDLSNSIRLNADNHLDIIKSFIVEFNLDVSPVNIKSIAEFIDLFKVIIQSAHHTIDSLQSAEVNYK